MKKCFIAFMCLTVLLLSACSPQEAAPSPDSQSQEAAVDYENSIEGRIIDATMHTMQIETDDKVQYLFTYDPDETFLDTGKDGISIDATVKIGFDGKLDEAKDVQDVVVKSIIITG